VPDVATDEGLLAIAERIRRRVATICRADHATLGDPAAATRVVPVSIGAVRFPAAGLGTVDDLVRAADSAL
jgi:GGDEF domain-containing protein